MVKLDLLVFEGLLEVASDRGLNLADLIGFGEHVVSILSNLGFVLLGGGPLWIAINSGACVGVIQGPEHDTSEVILGDVVNYLLVNFEAFPDTSSSLESWLETHDDLILVLMLGKVIKDHLILL